MNAILCENWYALAIAVCEQVTPEQAFSFYWNGRPEHMCDKTITKDDIQHMIELREIMSCKEIGELYNITANAVFRRTGTLNKSKRKTFTEAEIKHMTELRKTMSCEAIGKLYNVSASVVFNRTGGALRTNRRRNFTEEDTKAMVRLKKSGSTYEVIGKLFRTDPSVICNRVKKYLAKQES